MSKEAHRVLIIEDDKSLRTGLALSLKAEGYAVLDSATIAFALVQIRDHQPDLILLDLGLPDADGMSLIMNVRAAGDHTPIIVLTARDDETSKVKALDLGADDYVSKPFGLAELLARIRSAFRHGVQARGSAPIVQTGRLSIDLARRRVSIAGDEVRLSRKEFDLLAELGINLGKPVSHADLLRAVWGDENTDIQYLRVYIRQLREKIEAHQNDPHLLQAIPGFGYKLAAQ